MNAQVGVDKGANEPCPDGTLVAGRITRAQITTIVTCVRRVIWCQATMLRSTGNNSANSSSSAIAAW